MSKSALLATTAIILLSFTCSAAPRPGANVGGLRLDQTFRGAKTSKVLYGQNSRGNGDYINSQNYTSGLSTGYNDSGADDFIVPKGAEWTVTEIDVTGCCSGTPVTEDVAFYQNYKGQPGRAVEAFTNLRGAGNPNFRISLGKRGVKLKPGHYWVSVVANCAHDGTCGQWSWGTRSKTDNDPAVWEQPGNGSDTGCTIWGTLSNCFDGQYSGDFLFELKGTSKGK